MEAEDATTPQQHFKSIKDLTKCKTTRTTVIEDNDGNLLTDKAAISNRWKEYCQLTSDKDLLRMLRSISSANQEDDPPILASEVAAAIESLKDGKSPGIDNVPAERLKKGGQTTI